MLTIVLYIIIAFMVIIAVGQINSYQRNRTVKRYFKARGLSSILVCDDDKTTAYWTENIDKEKYGKIEIFNIKSRSTWDEQIWEVTVRKVGVMRYPCMLTLEDNEIRGAFFPRD